MRIHTLTAAAAFMLMAPLFGSSGEKGEGPLIRPDPPPDADAKGEVSIRHDDDGDDRFEVKAEHIDPLVTYEVYLESALGSGSFTSIGSLAADDDDDEPGDDDQPVGSPDDDGELKLEFRSDHDRLPLDLAAVAELIGLRLEIRADGDVYLAGIVPAFGSGEGSGSWLKAQTYLVRSATTTDENAKGRVEVAQRSKDNRQRFKVKAEHLPAGSYSLFLEEAPGSGNLVEVAALLGDDESDDDDGDDDEFEYEADTGDGDALPLGATSLDDLAGRLLEVRDSSGALVFLSGAVPDLASASGGSGSQKGEVKLSGNGVELRLKLRARPAKGDEELTLQVKKAVAGAALELHVRNPANDQLELVVALTASGKGEAKFRVRTKKGDPLPFGVLHLSDLVGQSLELRDTAGVLIAGQVPALD